MSVVSMTGFGRGVAARGGLRVEVELSSVNRRQFDVRIALPRMLVALEARVHAMVHARLSRGQVSGTVRVSSVEGKPGRARAVVDAALAAEFVRQLRTLARQTGMDETVTAGDLARMPGVLAAEAPGDASSEVWPLLKRALADALRELVVMRGKEGEALGKDLLKRVARLRRQASRFDRWAPLQAQRCREQLLGRLRQAGISVTMDDPALIKEVALLAERSDIAEELVRLGSHLEQAEKLLTTGGAIGRKADFLCQELLREVNTIGSKSSDLRITRTVIDFKAMLETVREQVQNVE